MENNTLLDLTFHKIHFRVFPGGASGKESVCQYRRHRDEGSISRGERAPGGGNGNTLQCSCLGNPMDQGAWWATVHGVSKSLQGVYNLKIIVDLQKIGKIIQRILYTPHPVSPNGNILHIFSTVSQPEY